MGLSIKNISISSDSDKKREIKINGLNIEVTDEDKVEVINGKVFLNGEEYKRK